MKKTFPALLLSIITLNASAVDRIVEEFGVSPTYSNIASAVAASSDGDRIIIKNRAGDIPWIENITVDHSLEFLSYANDGFFIVQGTYTIACSAGREVLINGMRNTSGGITFSGTAATRSMTVRVMDGFFVNGSISLATNAIHAHVIGNTLQNGTVSINFGNVVGNDIDGSNISDEGISIITTGAGASIDTAAVIGNKVKSSVGYEGIYTSSLGQNVHIRNNYIQHGWMGIEVWEGPPNGVANYIWNNTITAYTGNFTTYGVSLANTNTGSIWEVMNNVVTRTWSGTNRGINNDSGNQGQINVYFNHVSSNTSIPVSNGFTFTGNNTTDQLIVLDADGALQAGASAIDGGNPAAPYYDLDLSTGDAGAYGGSYTLDNFFPLHTGAARVYMTGHPFNLRSGNTLRLRANAWDR